MKNMGEIYGPPPVPGAKYVRDGKYYTPKFQLIISEGVLGPVPEEEPIAEVHKPDADLEALLNAPDPPTDLMDRIKIKRAADPNFLTKHEIKDILTSLGDECADLARRDDLLCRLKEAIGYSEDTIIVEDEDGVEPGPA